jgi:hypothetical protein
MFLPLRELAALQVQILSDIIKPDGSSEVYFETHLNPTNMFFGKLPRY